ncbi:MAG: HEAT repeat domain-containing protein [Planctomycetota bacterium]|nr:HEAT repeat domain-containing protein [Planctomycetota bacterium]
MPWVSQVPSLLKNLDDDDFDVRDAAHAALVKIGPQAWPMLEPALYEDGSPEVAARIRRLAYEWAILTKAQKQVASVLREQLHDENDTVRVSACDGLLSMGPGGIQVLKELLSSAKAKPVLNVTLDKPSYGFDEPFRTHVDVRNDGIDPFWYRGSFVTHSWNAGEVLGEPRPVDMYTRRYMSRRIGCGFGRGYVNPIIYWKPVVSGATYVQPEVETAKRASGTCRIMGAYTVTVNAALTGGSIAPRLNPDEPATITLEIGKGMPEEFARLRQCVTYFALPDFDKETGDPTLEVACETRSDRGVVDGTLAASVRFSPKGEGPDVALEEDLVRFAWYAFLDEDRVPVQYGSLASAVAKDGEDAYRPVCLKSGQASAFALNLPLPAKPGDYRLVIGYELGERYTHANCLPPCFGSAGMGPEVSLYAEGRIWSKPVEVSVHAPDADE